MEERHCMLAEAWSVMIPMNWKNIASEAASVPRSSYDFASRQADSLLCNPWFHDEEVTDTGKIVHKCRRLAGEYQLCSRPAPLFRMVLSKEEYGLRGSGKIQKIVTDDKAVGEQLGIKGKSGARQSMDWASQKLEWNTEKIVRRHAWWRTCSLNANAGET